MPVDLQQYLEDFDDLRVAHEAYLNDCRKLEQGGSSQAGIALRLAMALQEKVKRLSQAVTNGHAAGVLCQEWRSDALVFVGDARKKLSTRRVGGCDAVLIDLDLFLRLALLVYVIGLDRENDIAAEGLAAFLLLSIIVPRDEEFPHIDSLLQVFASSNARLVNDIISLTGNFILYHELGHVYARQHPTDFLRVTFQIPPGIRPSPETVKSIRIHPEGIIYNQIDASGTANGILVITPRFQHWRAEFAADVFAAYADVLAGAYAKPRALDLERWASCLTCWQVLLLALGYRQQYMQAIAGDDNFSHPVAAARIDVLIHHINFLAETFAPQWRSPALGMFNAQYQSLWATDLKKLMQDGIEYVRYAFDEDGPEINVGRIRSFTGGPVPHVPSALSKLGEHFLGPLLLDARRIGWDKAVQNRRKEHIKYLETFRLNGRPICLQLGKRLRDVNIRLISEDRNETLADG